MQREIIHSYPVARNFPSFTGELSCNHSHEKRPTPRLCPTLASYLLLNSIIDWLHDSGIERAILPVKLQEVPRLRS